MGPATIIAVPPLRENAGRKPARRRTEGRMRDRTHDRAPRAALDARYYQIAALSALLGYGLLGVHFELTPLYIATLIGAALGTQYLCTRLWRLSKYDPLSALISGIGLCTLLRTTSLAV